MKHFWWTLHEIIDYVLCCWRQRYGVSTFCSFSRWGLGNLSHWHDHDLREYEECWWRLLNFSKSNKLRQSETVPWWKTVQQRCWTCTMQSWQEEFGLYQARYSGFALHGTLPECFRDGRAGSFPLDCSQYWLCLKMGYVPPNGNSEVLLEGKRMTN